MGHDSNGGNPLTRPTIPQVLFAEVRQERTAPAFAQPILETAISRDWATRKIDALLWPATSFSARSETIQHFGDVDADFFDVFETIGSFPNAFSIFSELL